MNLLAVDTTQADALLRGRISPSWGTIAAPLRPAARTSIALPGSPSSLLLDLESSLSARPAGSLLVSLVVEDPLGTRTPVELPPVPVGGTSVDVAATLPATAPGLRLVGLVAQILPASTDTDRCSPAGRPRRSSTSS